METTQKYRHRTISGILWNKFLDTLHDSSWYDIFLTVAKSISWLMICIFLINTHWTIENLAMAIKWYDFAILKILGTFIIVFCAPLLTASGKKLLEWIKNNIPELPKIPVHGPQYMWIPIIELVDYLFTSDSFSRNEFCEKFAVSRKVFDDMANSFDSLRVFVRGANNARVLSEEYSRTDITSILTRAAEYWEIRPLIRATKIWYTHKWSMSDILSRGGFTTRPLHELKG